MGKGRFARLLNWSLSSFDPVSFFRTVTTRTDPSSARTVYDALPLKSMLNLSLGDNVLLHAMGFSDDAATAWIHCRAAESPGACQNPVKQKIFFSALILDILFGCKSDPTVKLLDGQDVMMSLQHGLDNPFSMSRNDA